MKNHWLDKKKEKAAETAFGNYVVHCDPCIDFAPTIITGDSTPISSCTINWVADKVFDNNPVVTCVVQCPQAEWTYTITS